MIQRSPWYVQGWRCLFWRRTCTGLQRKYDKLDYLLADGLYACEEFWRVCESKGVSGVVKSPEESLTILQDAKRKCLWSFWNLARQDTS